jgi:hypothetical protein
MRRGVWIKQIYFIRSLDEFILYNVDASSPPWYKVKGMYDRTVEDDGMPSEIDFSKGVRGLHHVPSGSKVFVPASIERSVWEYFARKAEQKGVALPDLLTDVLKRDIEINEAPE